MLTDIFYCLPNITAKLKMEVFYRLRKYGFKFGCCLKNKLSNWPSHYTCRKV